MNFLAMEFPGKYFEKEMIEHSLTFQQMYLELNSIIIRLNLNKIDRDELLVYLSNLGYINLNQEGKRKLSKGYLAKRDRLDIHEVVYIGPKGDAYPTITFDKSSRVNIYKTINGYYSFQKEFPLTSTKLSKKELSALKEMVNENFSIDTICLNLLRKPMVIYSTIKKMNYRFPDALTDCIHSA